MTEQILREIVRQHGLTARQITPLRSTGVVNSVYALDDAFVLRVANRGNPDALCDSLTESVAAPAACAAGIRTPRWSFSTILAPSSIVRAPSTSAFMARR